MIMLLIWTDLFLGQSDVLTQPPCSRKFCHYWSFQKRRESPLQGTNSRDQLSTALTISYQLPGQFIRRHYQALFLSSTYIRSVAGDNPPNQPSGILHYILSTYNIVLSD
jgi:hypothetical protein